MSHLSQLDLPAGELVAVTKTHSVNLKGQIYVS